MCKYPFTYTLYICTFTCVLLQLILFTITWARQNANQKDTSCCPFWCSMLTHTKWMYLIKGHRVDTVKSPFGIVIPRIDSSKRVLWQNSLGVRTLQDWFKSYLTWHIILWSPIQRSQAFTCLLNGVFCFGGVAIELCWMNSGNA
jgi:hypothetical protein